MNLEELMASTPPMQQHTLIKGFQAGAASRDDEFARLRAINSKLCEKSNWYVIHTARLEEERDQLRAQINVLREALKEAVEDYSDRFDMSSKSTNPGIKAVVAQGKEALAATEPKP